MTDRPHYPVNLVLAGRRCLVVGGGGVAARKIGELVACGAVVQVVAPEVGDAVRAMVDGDAPVTWDERPYREGDVAGYWLVVAATDSPETNHAVFVDGEAHQVWVNSADDPDNCSVTLPARLRQGPLLVTFSTGGQSPAVASWLRRRHADEFGPEYATLIDMVAEERTALRSAGQSTEGLDWQGALDSGMLELIREGNLAEAKERLRACLSSSSD